jgi:hypothetical protein
MFSGKPNSRKIPPREKAKKARDNEVNAVENILKWALPFLVVIFFCATELTLEETPTQALFDASAKGNVEEVRALIEKGADINAVYIVSNDEWVDDGDGRQIRANYKTPAGWSPLMFAAAYNNGRPPLHEAGNAASLSLLLSAGAEINARDHQGRTCLMGHQLSSA